MPVPIGINGAGESRGKLANPGSPGRMAVKTECACVFVCVRVFILFVILLFVTLCAKLSSAVYCNRSCL